MEPAELLASTVDKSRVPPLHQKRIVAFINHFLINSCSFLNEFAERCESKFIELERKMQRLEVALAIMEAKLASIPDDAKAEDLSKISEQPTETTAAESVTPQLPEAPADTGPIESPQITKPTVRAFEDARYYKYFKLVRVGALPDEVKLKMQAEGINPSILDTPNLELPDGVKYGES